MTFLRPMGVGGVGILWVCTLQNAWAQATPEQVAEIGMHMPPAVGRSVKLGHSNPNKLLHVCVALPFGDPAGMQAFVDSVSDPHSRNYRDFITPDEVGARFGLPLGQVQAVASYLGSKGMKVKLLSKNRLSVLADATVAQAEAAFHTTINEYQSTAEEQGNTQFFSFAQPPKLPTTISASVQNISGLESYTRPKHMTALTPALTATLYNLSPICGAGMYGQGRTVAISSWDGFRLSNVPLYYTQFGLPTPAGGVGSNISVFTINGGSGSGTPGVEGDVDIQMVLGVAPLCNLRIYDGDPGDMLAVLSYETNENVADIVTESYMWSIDSLTANTAHNFHLSMSAQGMTYMAGSGDSGTTSYGDNTGFGYNYPQFDPEVLSVGGTVATTDTSGNRTSEVAWAHGGGGWAMFSSPFNILPSWQKGNGVPTNINYRLLPDVAIHAAGSGSGAYYFFFNGALSSGYSGTSFASPVFAGSLAVAEQKIIAGGGLPTNSAGKQRMGRIQDLIYAQNGRPDVWHDITSGSNGILFNGVTSSAGPGWDFTTGWGAPDFNAFAATQIPSTVPPVPTNLSAAGGNNKVSCAWTACAGATKYHLMRSTTNGSGYVEISSPTSPCYTDLTAVNGTTYYYVVNAINSVGASAYSNQASATPMSPADFTIAVTPASQSIMQGMSADYSITTTVLNGFAGTTAFSVTGLPSGANASFSPSSLIGAGTTTCTVGTASATPAGTFTVTFTGTSGSLTHSTSATLTVNAVSVGDFALSVTPAFQTVRHSRSASYSVTVTGSGGFTCSVSLSASGMPAGTTATFSPSAVSSSGTSTMTLQTAGNARGTFTITIIGASGSTTHSTTVTLTIT